ncbi:MAG: lysophospholipid acyltransferase family protein [Burkholderiales bacterium]|nr:lysophospholipid acyltransferase family protein [Burkholderiales bacterium]
MLYKFLAVFPLPVLYLGASLVYFIIFRVLRFRKALVLENLRNSFPEKSEAELNAIARQCYRNFSEVLAELIKGNRISEAELRRRVIIEHTELAQDYYDAGRSVVLLASHHCNWEWLLLASCLKLPFPVDAVYRELKEDRIDSYMLAVRRRFGGNPISTRDFMLEVMRRKNATTAFALVADQTPAVDDAKCWLRFLNQDTAFFVGPQRIARIAQAPVFFISMERLRRGYYRASLQLLAEPPYAEDDLRIIQSYAIAAEEQIRQSPADWLWLYRKWKYKKPLYS